MKILLDTSLQVKEALQNTGATERILRMIIGSAMIGVWFFYPIGVVNLWYALLPLTGAVVALTGLMGWCPIRAVIHHKSCGLDPDHPCGPLPYQIDRAWHHFRKHS